jgi:AcrR family transcriptional regulator
VSGSLIAADDDMPRQAERSAGTRRRILDAARELYAEYGWAGTPLDDVARAAGVTKGAVYHHFSGKAALLRALYEDQEQHSVEGFVAAAAEHDDALDALRAGCHAFLTACLEPTFRRISLIEAPAVLGWEEWRAIDARYGFGLLRAGVEAAMDARRLRRLPVDHVAHLLLAALMEAALLVGRADKPLEMLDEIAPSFDALLDGLETQP